MPKENMTPAALVRLLCCLTLFGVCATLSQTVTYRGVAHNYGSSLCGCPATTLAVDSSLTFVALDSIPAALLEQHIQVTGDLDWCEDTFCPPGTFVLHPSKIDTLQTHEVSRPAGWSMVSSPLLLNGADYATAFLRSASSPTAFRRGYVADSVRPGVGYWLKSADSSGLSITGVPVDAETVEVEAGWNMIGSIAVPVPVGGIASADSTLELSPFYSYVPASGQYVTANPIAPWSAYWVKANKAGAFILRNPAHLAAPSTTRPVRISEDPGLPPSPPRHLGRSPASRK